MTRGFFLMLFALAAGLNGLAAGVPRNLFGELLGKTEAETTARIEAVWRQFTEGDAAAQRLYYETPEDTAYIADVGNGDVRSEGMSYGMMIAVQLDRKDQFDRLWRWTCAHMLARPFVKRLWDSPTPTGRWRYYDGLLTMLGLLQASGRFRSFEPAPRAEPTHSVSP